MRCYLVGWMALFLSLAVATFPVAGQETRRSASSDDLRELEERAGDFLRDFRGTTGAERALRSFVEDSTLAERDADVDKLVSQATKLESQYGKLLGHELIGPARSLGEDLVAVRYLLKAEEFPIVWHFYFYRAPTNSATMLGSRPWKLIEIRFDTNLESLER